MAWRQIGNYVRLICAIALLTATSLAASVYRGLVTFGGLPVPGATVTATMGDKKLVSITDDQGIFSFPDLTSGTWTIEVEMQGFSPVKDEVVIAPNTPAAPPWELKMLPLDEIKAEIKAVVPAPAEAAPEAKNDLPKPPDKTGQPKQQDNKAAAPAAPAEETDQRAADGLLINGSTNNGAASPFAQLAAFGNSRAGGRSLYNGSIGAIISNSALNANQYALSGVATPKPAYNQVTGLFTFGGPIKIPHVWKNGPTFNVQYQWTRNGNDSTASGLVPTLAERGGDLSQAVNAAGQPVQFVNPATGLPFTNNTVPVNLQAAALLNLYPMPNITGNPRYNYQVPIVANTHVDAMQSRFNKQLNRKDSLYGLFSFQSIRSSNPNLFEFVDRSNALGLHAAANWSHRFNQHLSMVLTYDFSRQASLATPYWENRENVSGQDGITGNLQNSMNWGPPSLGFSISGITPLTDGIASHTRKQTGAVSDQFLWRHGLHNVQFGSDIKRQEFNYLSQQNPRGTFNFTGAATAGTIAGSAVTGSDLADFLLGVPDTSAIAYGNADKYFRDSVYDAYLNDDWRVKPQLTINVGLRWEYGAPMTELFGRLVNLDITPSFSAEQPVLASNPVGALTGQHYPNSLVRPDKHGIEPRLSLSWRPLSGSSMVVRAGYSLTYDTSVYQTIATQMAQQAPLSTSLNVQNSAACPLTLASGFNGCSSVTPDTYAIDPNFRVGYLQTWQTSVQRDLPGSLQVTVTYLGNKGTRGVQAFLPNTYPIGATNPCPACLAGYTYITSNGNSNRESGTVQVRRRLHNGLTATAQYTYSKSIDDDSAMGGQGTSSPIIAQNWLDLKGQRGLSTFDQRHLVNLTLQYTTGMGLGGKSLMDGWKGRLYKEWTVLNQITIGSGLPLTPYYLEAVPGTGITGTIRGDFTGAPLYSSTTAGVYLNPAAVTAPVAGQWGTAGRDSITGPDQFSWNASMSRTFRFHERYNLDLVIQATNVLNHVTLASYVTTVNSSLFGTPTTANAMRSIVTTLRLRF